MRLWIANEAHSAELVFIIDHISDKRECNNCFIKENQKTLLDLPQFALQEQTEDNLMVAISRAWYNGSYTCTMGAKPIKSLELHIQLSSF